MADLCTIANVKTYLGVTGSDSDTLLTALVQGVSARMERYMRRLIGTGAADEYHDGAGVTDALCLRKPPITGTPTVTISAVAFTDFEQDDVAGILYYTNGVWPKGRQNIRAQYTGGFATVPIDLREACVKQVAFEGKLADVRGNKLGIAAESDAAGTSVSMITTDWVLGVLDVLDSYRSPI